MGFFFFFFPTVALLHVSDRATRYMHDPIRRVYSALLKQTNIMAVLYSLHRSVPRSLPAVQTERVYYVHGSVPFQ